MEIPFVSWSRMNTYFVCGFALRNRFCQVAILLALTGCAVACGGSAPKDQSTGEKSDSTETYVAPDAKGIQTLTVQTTTVPEYMELPAHIEADPTRVVHVFAPAGGRIIEMKVRPWDRVKKGETLAILDSGDLSRALSDYQKARADDDVKQKQLARSEDLLAHHAIAERDYQQAQADAAMAQAELKTAADQLRVLGADPTAPTSALRVIAPRSGVVLDIGAAPGEYSKSLDAPLPLCTIADISTVWAMGDIYEKDLTAARAGEEAQVALNAYSNQHWSGRVSVVSDTVDPVTRTVRVRVVLPNPAGRIKPAMFGTIRLLRSSSQGILVPSSAVVREGNDAFLFVAKGDNRFERRSVTLGRAFDGSLEIASGLKPTERIVSEGALLLKAAASNP
ncbi:MAG: efflux RND transporter periplasmic adaptor subunit [Candidatus Acidiferrales bacterium]